MRPRLTAVAAIAALAALPATASGTTARPQIRDMKGDVRGGLAELDILSAQWSSTGRGASKALVATLTLAAPAKTDRAATYELHSQVRGCGSVLFEYAPGTVVEATNLLGQPQVNDGLGGYSMWLECGGAGGSNDSRLIWRELTFAVKGNVITWSVPLTALPDEVQVGARFSDFQAVADVGEPVFGMSLVGRGGQSLDYAEGDGVWKLR